MNKPMCIGQFMNHPGEDCSICRYRIECYNIFRAKEKKLEELKKRIKNFKHNKKFILERLEFLTCPSCS